MKKILAIVLALVMALALVACGGNEPAPTTPPTQPATTPATEPATEPATQPTEAAVTVMTYAEYAAAELDTEVTVETTIQAVESWWDGCMQLYCQSADGAYYVYDLACTEEEAAQLVPGTVIRVTGWKGEWSGEVEIMEATYEIIEGEAFTATATDYTALLGTDELTAHMNELASLKGLTVVASTMKDAETGEETEHPFLYKWDGSGAQGDDLYFNVELNGTVYTFTVNVYMNLTGSDSDVYKAVEALQIGDVIDVEGFLYWYNGLQTHVTSVTVAE